MKSSPRLHPEKFDFDALDLFSFSTHIQDSKLLVSTTCPRFGTQRIGDSEPSEIEISIHVEIPTESENPTEVEAPTKNEEHI